jgi:FixJ family two-component response regulator
MNPTNEVRSGRSSSQLSSDAPTVFVIDGDKSERESLESLIADAGWQPRSFNSAKAFLASPRLMVRSCLVSEIWLPDLDGLRLQGLLTDRSELPIIFLTGRADISTTVQAMKGGAVEVLTKPIVKEVLLNALRQAFERSGEALRREGETRALRHDYASLSRRERQVMDLILQGLMNKQIGAELGISVITVKTHRGKVMRKMEARSVAGLVIMATLLGLVTARNKPRAFGPTARPTSRPPSGSERFHRSHLATEVAYPLVAGVGAFPSA